MSAAKKHSIHRTSASVPASRTSPLTQWARAIAVAGLCLSWAPVSGQQSRVGQSPAPLQGVPEGRPFQPNILLFVLDDVGTDKLAMYGESDSEHYASRPYCG